MLLYRTAVRYRVLKPCLSTSAGKPAGRSKKRSFCDYCGRQLRWFENVPIVSWVIQKGKTRCCGKKLSVTYPVIEIITGLLFLIFNLKFTIFNQFSILQFLIGLVIIVLLVFSAVFDLKYMILPDFSTIILIIIAFAGVIFDEKNIIPYLLSAVCASGFLLFLHVVTKGKGMGMGDVKYALFMGLLLGPEKTIIAFYVAFITGAVAGLVLIFFRKMGRKSAIPFGPFLILGTLVSWWWGAEIGAIFQKVLK